MTIDTSFFSKIAHQKLTAALLRASFDEYNTVIINMEKNKMWIIV